MISQPPADSSRYSLVSFRDELEWRKSYYPVLIAFGWLFERGFSIHPVNQVIDYAFNFMRYTTTRAIITRPSDYFFEETRGSRKAIQLFVLTYQETPSILWVDQDIEDLSRKINRKVVTRARKCPLTIKYANHIILRKWQAEGTLEQYSKKTLASSDPTECLKDKKISETGYLPKNLYEEFLSMKTFIDRIRGRTSTFIALLLAQVLLAYFTNWLKTGITTFLSSMH